MKRVRKYVSRHETELRTEGEARHARRNLPSTLSEHEQQIWLALLEADDQALTLHALSKRLDIDDIPLRVALLSLLAAGHLRQEGWKYILQPFGERRRVA